MAFVLKKGFTKTSVMETIRKYNNGKTALADGHKSACAYLNSQGNRCAIGCFIPDGHPGLKCMSSVGPLLRQYPELKEFMPFEYSDNPYDEQRPLNAMQEAHDDTAWGSGNVYEEMEAFLNQHCEEAS